MTVKVVAIYGTMEGQTMTSSRGDGIFLLATNTSTRNNSARA